jgi:hypothetical protein
LAFLPALSLFVISIYSLGLLLSALLTSFLIRF